MRRRITRSSLHWKKNCWYWKRNLVRCSQEQLHLQGIQQYNQQVPQQQLMFKRLTNWMHRYFRHLKHPLRAQFSRCRIKQEDSMGIILILIHLLLILPTTTAINSNNLHQDLVHPHHHNLNISNTIIISNNSKELQLQANNIKDHNNSNNGKETVTIVIILIVIAIPIAVISQETTITLIISITPNTAAITTQIIATLAIIHLFLHLFEVIYQSI